MSSSQNPDKPDDSKDRVRHFLSAFQNELTQLLATLDGNKQFVEDAWTRDGLGYGRTRTLTAGDLFESAGVNFSEISGTNVPASLLGRYPDLAGERYWGAGVSLVLHPLNPYCPTVHLNYRYFEAGSVWWFGGGCDLTPYYAFDEDCIHWHRVIKQTMDQTDERYYPAYKYWCDEYFYNHHRDESRGIGGSFYDYQNGEAGPIIQADFARRSAAEHHVALELQQQAKSWEELFAFHRANADSFFSAYLPIIERRRDQQWGERERQFQLYRRGRYVEFNLLHDRGTLFGIQSKGRIESIFMSLPPLVRWQYGFEAEDGSPEQLLTEKYLRKGIDWVA